MIDIKIVVLVTLAAVLLRGERHEAVFRENFGVVFTHVGLMESVQDVWHQTFAVDVSSPILPRFAMPCKPKTRRRQKRANREYMGSFTFQGARCEHPGATGVCLASPTPSTTTATTFTPLTLEPEAQPNSSASTPYFERFCPAIRGYEKRHALLIRAIVRAQKETDLLLPSAKSQSRQRRGLFNAVGEIYKSLFGTATVTDQRVLSRHIDRVAVNNRLTLNKLQFIEDAFESYMKKNNEHADIVRNAIILTNEAVNLSRVEIESEIDQLTRRDADTINFLHLINIHYTAALSDVLNVLTVRNEGLHKLLQGFLPPELVSGYELDRTLAEIKRNLSGDNNIRPTHENFAYYFHIRDITYSRVNDTLFIKLKIPLSSTSDLFNIYRFHSVPMPIGQNRNESTRIAVEKNYLAVSQNNNFYATLSDTEYEICAGNTYKRCDKLLIVKETLNPDCMYALFIDNVKLISKLCKSVQTRRQAQSVVLTTKPGKYFVSSTDARWTQYCPDVAPKYITACTHCVITVPCKCALKGHDFYIPPTYSACAIGQVNYLHSVNLPVLYEFYKQSKDVFNISSRATFQTPLSVKLPQLEIVEDKLTSVVSDLTEKEFSLKKVAKSITENRKMYATPTAQLIDDLGLFSRQETDIWLTVITGLNCICAIVALTIAVRNFRLLGCVKTVTAANFDFIDASTTSAPRSLTDIEYDLYELIKIGIIAFAFLFIFALFISIYYRLRKRYFLNKKSAKSPLMSLPFHTTIYAMLYGNGKYYMIQVFVTPLHVNQLTSIHVSDHLRKPVYHPGFFGLYGKLICDWRSFELQNNFTFEPLQLKTTINTSVFDYGVIKDVIEHLSVIRFVGYYGDRCFELYQWQDADFKRRPTKRTTQIEESQTSLTTQIEQSQTNLAFNDDVKEGKEKENNKETPSRENRDVGSRPPALMYEIREIGE